MNQENVQKKMDRFLLDLEKQEEVPTLLLHSCCGPCSSYVISYLSDYFKITVFFYNPNIAPKDEYEKRKAEQKRLIRELPTKYEVSFEEGDYAPERFDHLSRGVEEEPEGGHRCQRCYAMRMAKTARKAKSENFDFFTTTLSVSPYKNAQKLNDIGEKLGKQLEISYLPSDFKKKEGYKKSVALSRKYNLYRQGYCGCAFSLADYENREKEKEDE